MQFSITEVSSICPIFSPCFNYFATLGNNCIYIKDAGCSDLKNHSVVSFKSNNVNPKPINLKFSSDSKLIAVKVDSKIEVFDIQGNLKLRIKDDNCDVDDYFWSQDTICYQLVVFFSGLTICFIYNLQTGQQSHIKNYKLKNSNGYTFSRGSHPGVFMAMLQRHNSKDCISIYFTQTWQLINFITLDSFDAAKIEFTDNGNILVIQNKINFKVYVVDVFKGVSNSYGDKDYCLGVSTHKFSKSQSFLALGAHDDCIHLLNTDTWKLISEIQISQKLDLTKTVLQKEQNNQFVRWQDNKYKIQAKKQIDDCGNVLAISHLEFSPNDQYLAAKIETLPNCIFIYEIKSLQLVTVIQTASIKTIKDFKWLQNSIDENTLCIATGTSTLLFWKDSNEEGSIFEISVPTNDIKITNIELGKKDKLMLYSSSQKKYCYAIYENYAQ